MIDDSAEVLDALARLLEREGVTVLGTAMTGADGLRVARERDPDVVLVDVDLGQEWGFDVARALGIARLRATIIMISAAPDYAGLEQELPAAGFLSKGSISRRAIEAIVARSTGA